MGATKCFASDDCYSGSGVGDDPESWGFDGVRGATWHDGPSRWACPQASWKAGDVIGFAANLDTGMITCSKNGVWCDTVAFKSEQIKLGVYICICAVGYALKYNLDGKSHGDFK